MLIQGFVRTMNKKIILIMLALLSVSSFAFAGTVAPQITATAPEGYPVDIPATLSVTTSVDTNCVASTTADNNWDKFEDEGAVIFKYMGSGTTSTATLNAADVDLGVENVLYVNCANNVSGSASQNDLNDTNAYRISFIPSAGASEVAEVAIDLGAVMLIGILGFGALVAVLIVGIIVLRRKMPNLKV